MLRKLSLIIFFDICVLQRELFDTFKRVKTRKGFKWLKIQCINPGNHKILLYYDHMHFRIWTLNWT